MVKNFDGLVKACVEALNEIWPNPFNFVKFWCIKYSEDPIKAREVTTDKDSYDR